MSSLIKNDRLLRAIKKQPVDATPVWLMRQAGRYLPEYLRVRRQAGDFLTLCKTPELASEVTLQPLARFDLDAAIIFSDILTIPDAMGLGLHFVAGKGPKFMHPINGIRQIEQLPAIDVGDELKYVSDAIKLTKQALKQQVPLIGFSGSPWTLACYMIEGQGSKTFSRAKAMLYQEPDALMALIDKLVVVIVDYLMAQIEAGADCIMLFDTWGGLLTQQAYLNYALAPMQRILHAIAKKVPTILFTKGGGLWLSDMAESGADALGLDWCQNLTVARQAVGGKVALQGNLDPSILYAKQEIIVDEVKAILSAFGFGPGHIFNLGHGIYPDIDPKNVQVMIDAVHKYSRQYHN